MPPPLLLLQDISLTFGTTPLLSGAALPVTAGDRICLVGSGKSTLLRIAAGLVQPDAGEYLLKELGLSGDEDPDSLSGGEARRAALTCRTTLLLRTTVRSFRYV